MVPCVVSPHAMCPPISRNHLCVVALAQVADMLNPEYYVGEYRRPDGSWATAKFADQVGRHGREESNSVDGGMKVHDLQA